MGKAKTMDASGNEIEIDVNEVKDIANYISKGKKPPNGFRFCQKKYFIVGGTPRPEADGKRILFLGKGTGTNLICSVTTKFVYVAYCKLAEKGHVATEMNKKFKNRLTRFRNGTNEI